jgi:lipoprotein-anchoring transpeptidase ErfK/SrfK
MRQTAGKKRTMVVLAVLTLTLTAPVLAQSAQPISGRSKRTVLVSLPDRKLAVMDSGVVIATFRVAVGAAKSPSPTGEFEIINRVSNPTYYHSGKVIPTGKDNPLGTRWIGLSQKGYGIHGTNAPTSVGHAASHGCIRLRNRDAEKLFAMLRVGDVVQIRGERDEQIAQVFGGEDEKQELAEVRIPEQAASGN